MDVDLQEALPEAPPGAAPLEDARLEDARSREAPAPTSGRLSSADRQGASPAWLGCVLLSVTFVAGSAFGFFLGRL